MFTLYVYSVCLLSIYTPTVFTKYLTAKHAFSTCKHRKMPV